MRGVLASTSVCFDLSVFEMFAPMCMGGTVILARNALELCTAEYRDSVTLVNTVPSAMRQLVETNGVPASVETVNLAGEALTAAQVEQIYAATRVERVWDLYGPSEDTTYSTAGRRGAGGVASIGQPIANTQVYVLDEQMGLAPIGVDGELWVAGKGLARGYLGRPELTAERFVPNAYGEPGSRLYRTGDVVRWRADGSLEYLGRQDYQVKVRGFRIELGEIESALRQHEGVRDAVVVAREESLGDKRLVAYVVGKTGDLRGYLRAKLPGYMMPTAYVQLERLPLTPSGKLDRKALPAPEAGSAPSGGEAPRTPVEAVLAGIWAEVLRRELVGRHDNFFELGGHSLLATQVISRMRRAFGRELPLRTVFEHPTIAALAASVEAGLRGAEQPSAPPLTPAGGSGPMPLSYAQERLWFLDQLEPGSANYNIPAAVRLTGELNREALERSLEQLMERHQVLRTRYDEVEGGPAQVIEPPPRVELAARAVSGGAGLREELEEFVREPFDLRRGPVLRARLWRISEQEHVAAVSVHHIAFDGWSAGVMIGELGELYASACEQRAARLPELPVQYADYAVWQRGWLAGEALERELDYWRRQLEGYSGVVELPCDHARPAVRAHRGGRVEQRLSAELSAGLRKLSRREGATLFLTLLGGLDALLYHYTGQRDVAVGTAVANRTRVEGEGLIGFFVNTLVLRAEVRPEESFRGLLGRVRERGLEAHLHQDVPFEKVVEAVDPERDLSRTPLFQVMLVVQNAPAGVLELPGMRWETEAVGTGLAKFDLTIEVTESGDEALVSWEYDAELFEESRIARMAGHYERLLGGAVADVETPIRDLPLLSEAEEKQLLEAFSRDTHEECVSALNGTAEKTKNKSPKSAPFEV
jgi:non-ribosomal peptide synthetase component F